MEEKILTVKAYAVPDNRVLFRVLKNGEPAVGVTVSLIQQTSVTLGVETPILAPAQDVKTTDENGEVEYIHPQEWDKQKNLVIANIPNTAFGFVKGEWLLTHGESYEIKLKEHTKPPIMFAEFKLRDIIGAEQYGTLLGAVQAWNLKNAGFTNVKVLGKGTRAIKVEFTPPWGETSPLWIDFTATTKGIIALILVVVALGIIYITLWKIGTKAVGVAGGIGLALIALLLLAKRRG